MKIPSHTPGPFTFEKTFENGKQYYVCAKKIEVAIVLNREDAMLFAASPALNERLTDNTALIMKVHAIISHGFSSFGECLDKLNAINEDIEKAVVKNREALIKANGDE